jgi:hypothetical protein
MNEEKPFNVLKTDPSSTFYLPRTFKAVFIGENSLGYEHGETYRLTVDQNQPMTIRRIDGTGICPYSSIYSFFRNWRVIEE